MPDQAFCTRHPQDCSVEKHAQEFKDMAGLYFERWQQAEARIAELEADLAWANGEVKDKTRQAQRVDAQEWQRRAEMALRQRDAADRRATKAEADLATMADAWRDAQAALADIKALCLQPAFESGHQVRQFWVCVDHVLAIINAEAADA